jgi:uncharacterized protein YbjT (DUF2867 family)
MKVLLCGASGFIGQQLAQALRKAGHEVVATRSPASAGKGSGPAVNYAQDTHMRDWLPRVQGMDAVINAVGVLRDTRQRPIQPVHEGTPKALFDACAEAGVRRVIQVSALGVDTSQTVYARTKLAADAHLLALTGQGRLDGVILRPSVVYGRGGDSAAMFMGMAQLPVLILPPAVIKALVQPVAVQDLAEAAARLLGEAADIEGVVRCVGPARLSIAAFIASLRQQLGKGEALVVPLPELISTASARFGDMIPSMPWCSETLTMLGQDNIAEPEAFTALLGHGAMAPTQFVEHVWRAGGKA